MSISDALSRRSANLEDVNLLVLESAPATLRALLRRLASAGWNLESAPDLATAVAMTGRRAYDAVVLGPTFMREPDALAVARRAMPGSALVDISQSTASQAQAESILDNLPDPVLSFDLRAPGGPTAAPEGAVRPRLTWCNKAAERWFGRTGMSLMAAPGLVWGHVHGDDIAAVEAWFRAPTTEPTALRIRWVSHVGELRAADVLCVARGGRRGAPAIADLVLHDAAHEVALESAVATHRSQIRALVQRSDEVVFQMRVHPKLTVAWVNDTAPKLLGLDPLALREDATRLFAAMSPEDAVRVQTAMQAAVGEETTVRFTVARASGSARIELTMRPLRGDRSGLIARGREVADENAPMGAPIGAGVARGRTVAAVMSFAEAAANAHERHQDSAPPSAVPVTADVEPEPMAEPGRASRPSAGDELPRMIEVG